MTRGTALLALKRRSLVRSARGACVAVMILATRSLSAQEMEIPVASQIRLFLKVTTFDRKHSNGGQPVIFGVAFQSGNRASVIAKNEALRALNAAADQDAQSVRAIPIDLDQEPLPEALAREHLTVLYVTPLRAIAISDIAAATRAARVTTFTGVPRFVALGLSVGVRLQGDRAKLLVNLQAARAEGADFSAELLKLARLVP